VDVADVVLSAGFDVPKLHPEPAPPKILGFCSAEVAGVPNEKLPPEEVVVVAPPKGDPPGFEVAVCPKENGLVPD